MTLNFLLLFAGYLAADSLFCVADPHETSRFLRKGRSSPRNRAWHQLVLPGEEGTASTYIVGGRNTEVSQYPFFVEGAGCGGTLIHSDVVLTAAHCQGEFDGFVMVGPTFVGSTYGGATINYVSESIPHPLFDYPTGDYDFMLLRLRDAVTTTPVTLNSDPLFPKRNRTLTIVGFGYNGTAPAIQLQHGNVSAYSDTLCKTLYSGNLISPRMLCAGRANGAIDSCYGDSGGPLLDPVTGVQVGIVSWGDGCGSSSRPGVYSRISAVYDWIQSKLCEISRDPPPTCQGTRSNSLFNFDIVVKHDLYPNETSWFLKNDDTSKVLARQGAGTVKDPSATVKKSILAPSGNYTFSIADTVGDGMCCNYGSGRFDVFVEGARILGQDGQFAKKVVQSFKINQQGKDPKAKRYRVDIQYDSAPTETDVWLYRSTKSETIIRYPAGSVSIPRALVSIYVDLDRNATYNLLLTDSRGDGFCCGLKGNGFVAIVEETDLRENLLVNVTGDIMLKKSRSFIVP